MYDYVFLEKVVLVALLSLTKSNFDSTKANTGDFRYEPIKFYRDIRLLFIAPQQSHTNDIWCSTYQVSFREKPPYETLSYAWGDPELSESIICDGKRLRVTKNLYAALLRLRQSHALVPLWIDAICIDQNNTSERTKQVRLMKQIYENAKQVVVWLGEEVESDKDAFEALHSLNRFLLDFGKDQRNWAEVQGISSFGDTLQHLNFESPGFRALDSLFQRPWFMRAWVAQEVIVAPRALVTCGTLTIPWKIISRVVSTLIRRGLLQQLAHRVFSKGEGLYRADFISRAQASVSWGGTSLLDLLVSNRTCLSSDPRDKVFAVVGLAKDCKMAGILPDYRSKTAKIYQDVAIYLAKASCMSVVLSLAGDTSASRTSLFQELPSWVPDWSQREAKPPILMQFHAGGCMAEKFVVDETRGTLNIHGKIIDSIADIAKHQHRSESYLGDHRDMYEHNSEEMAIYDELLSRLKSYPTGETVEDAFWRTLIFNHKIDGSVAPQEFKKSYEALRATIKDQQYCAANPSGDTQVERETYTRQLMAHNFAETIHRWQSDMRPFVTENGFLGQVPTTARIGDVICVFLGAHVPFVLRPHERGGSYRVIGDCYLHGMMNGEALQASNILVQEITIQ